MYALAFLLHFKPNMHEKQSYVRITVFALHRAHKEHMGAEKILPFVLVAVKHSLQQAQRKKLLMKMREKINN